MPVTTSSAAIHITPVVIKTFFEHSRSKAKRLRESKPDEIPQDDIWFDEAFHIVKTFIDMGTKNTVESLQAFTNTHVPAPYWAAVSPVTITLFSCNAAADLLIEWFGPEEVKYVVGGERWWQVRGLDGVDGEWIAELEDMVSENEAKNINGRKLSNTDANILRMEKLETVMLYVHGGGYFWGSINTHRYQILHYAHKFKGRAFAVNYRKAPQYPWPCPLQDVLAAYLYLIRPPPGAIHKAISPSKIVLAGDSAGGGICLTILTVLRDLGLPMPAGAVLISPWVDLTHSFASVMENCHTDIIPKHGFLAKPSTLWPIPTQVEPGGRIVSTASNLPPKPGNVDTLKPSPSRIDLKQTRKDSVFGPGETVQTQEEMMDSSNSTPSNHESNSKLSSNQSDQIAAALQRRDLDHWEPKPPKVFMENPNAQPLELRSQIQMYATTEQLIHPLVSPILQGSLGNLPPLYIIGGDGELLRDEIIYLAHKAAEPSNYPTRKGVLRDSVRQQENAKKFTTPTKVHLQVFDGMCHVLTVFMFTRSASYAYHTIAQFVKHVTQNDDAHLLKNPFPVPNDTWKSTLANEHGDAISGHKPHKLKKRSQHLDDDGYRRLDGFHNASDISTSLSQAEVDVVAENECMPLSAVKKQSDDIVYDDLSSSKHCDCSAQPEADDLGLFIRERVDIKGKIRPMEPAEAIHALNIETTHIGLIKEAPAQRWRAGQDKWDKKYARKTKKVIKQKLSNEAKFARLLQNAFDEGFVHISCQNGKSKPTDVSIPRTDTVGEIQVDRRWGPLDLEDESPPATAIAGRRDTPEAIALLKRSIYHAAPVTHLTVPKLKTIDAIRAALDPNDNPNKPPKQSVAEEQVKTHVIPIHGLRIWDNLVRYFGKKTSINVATKIDSAAEKVGLKDGRTE
ncbi:alpha/beta-hydrolase [Pholiota conissans]|uniref:Alpha/beta-hydrolase n=1 Tax=Pholiota conissans TaxID=109636 RepID=A0A9P5YPZ1_9AGAR|nr:alpha/beta-hydrolase [Pholiota conissans]